MNDLSDFLVNFHFLRPAWLFLLPAGVGLCVLIANRNSTIGPWRRVIAPDLLPHLIVQGSNTALIRPVNVLGVLIALILLAMAGPAWQKIPTPFVKNNAPLVFAIELTPSMQAEDVQPTRLERALQKIDDLIDLKISAQIGLIVYSGSSHIVVPLTSDTHLLKLFIQNLKPEIMPLQGDNPAEALEVATALLTGNKIPGTIVFVTDGIDGSHAPEFAENQTTAKKNFLFYGFGTEAGGKTKGGKTQVEGINLRGIKAISETVKGDIILSSVDATDIHTIKKKITVYLEGASPSDEDIQWIDAGYFLTWPIALILLLWARRGWTVKWV